MIRKLLVVAGVAGVAIAAAIVMDVGHLAPFVKKMNSLEGLDASYSVTEVGGTQAKYHVVFSKPNKAMVDTPTKTFVADGTNLTVYDKKLNSYFVKQQPENLNKELLVDEDLAIWRPFFDVKAFDHVAATKNEGTRTRRGEKMDVLAAQVDKNGEYTVKFHVGQTDGLLKQAEMISVIGSTQRARVVNVDSMKTGAQAATLFAFNPPANAKQLTEADMMSAEWSYDYDKAMENAAAFGKGVIIDFYADW
jgi:outer membrane lipoprotein-sorting protein